MDPITTAIVSAVGKLAEPAVKDAYGALKDLIRRKFGEKSDVVDAIDKLEQKPNSDARAATVAEEVMSLKAQEDAELVRAALVLLEMARPSSNAGVNVAQNVRGTGNIFSGTGDVSVGQNKQ